ncbi:outer membrane beta-barrel protein [Mesorhizobium sp. CAU 1732]|uniref:outer membrane protein n=1 Tax=Mesorhizobium sp. CAU 1732 TaxID=3140358 RepID=UPI00326132CD
MTGIDNSISAGIAGVGTVSAESQLDYLGTVRARAGYAFDRALIYAHGGWAYGKTEQTLSLTDEFTGATDSISSSTSRSGWTVGAGVEFAVTEMISVGTEYAYTDLGGKDVFADELAGAGAYVSEDVRFHTVKAALNFRF